tara:strand:- start:507 stop:836 length:330 start_codon:yes stop_codon:yes gene_type:complete
MERIIIYGILLVIFTLIINLLKYDNNFKGLNYESSILEVISYVSNSLIGGAYLGIQPISSISKILIIILSVLKYLILFEVLLKFSIPKEHYNIFKGVEQIIDLETQKIN